MKEQLQRWKSRFEKNFVDISKLITPYSLFFSKLTSHQKKTVEQESHYVKFNSINPEKQNRDKIIRTEIMQPAPSAEVMQSALLAKILSRKVIPIEPQNFVIFHVGREVSVNQYLEDLKNGGYEEKYNRIVNAFKDYQDYLSQKDQHSYKKGSMIMDNLKAAFLSDEHADSFVSGKTVYFCIEKPLISMLKHNALNALEVSSKTERYSPRCRSS